MAKADIGGLSRGQHPKPSKLRYRHSPLQRCPEGIGLTQIVLMTWEEAGYSCGASEVTRAVRPDPHPRTRLWCLDGTRGPEGVASTSLAQVSSPQNRQEGSLVRCLGERSGYLVLSPLPTGLLGAGHQFVRDWPPRPCSPSTCGPEGSPILNPTGTGPIWVAKSAFYFRTYSSILELGMEIQNQGRNSK